MIRSQQGELDEVTKEGGVNQLLAEVLDAT